MRRRPALFGILLLVLGTGLFLRGAWVWRGEAAILWNGIAVEGTVISRQEIPVEGGKPRLEMVVEYPIGTELLRQTFVVARQLYEKDSSRVTVRYLADDPSRIRLSGEEMKPNDALVLGLMVSFLGLLICGIHALRRRQARELGEALPPSVSEQLGDAGDEAR
jgi:hypothetical protein